MEREAETSQLVRSAESAIEREVETAAAVRVLPEWVGRASLPSRPVGPCPAGRPGPVKSQRDRNEKRQSALLPAWLMLPPGEWLDQRYRRNLNGCRRLSALLKSMDDFANC
jgi:hypothetical protein